MAGSVVHFSNRVEIPKPGKVSAGGLDVAIASPPANMRMTRIGWSGKTISDSEYRPQEAVTETIAGGVRYITVDFNTSMEKGFYGSIANGGLWPLCHYRKDIFDMNRFPADDMEQYQAANRLFAQVGQDFVDPSDTLIVHDYHLMPLGKELIALNVNNPTGYYHHIPMPDSDLIGGLERNDQETVYDLLQGLFAYDLVGLQARRDFDALESVINHGRGVDVPKDYEVRAIEDVSKSFDRQTRFGVFPVIGKVHEDAKLAEIWEKRPETLAAKRAFGFGKSDIGIYGGLERLDYSKGHPNKFTAVGIAHQTGVVNSKTGQFLQVAPFGRSDVDAYKIEKAKVEQAHNTLTSIFGNVARLHMDKVQREIGLGLARQSKVGLITPLRDGANLAAAEYIAAQDPKDPGVLVLSKFAGIAERVAYGVELVDPYRPHDIARGLKNAFSRTLEERIELHAKAMAGLTTHTNADWQGALINETNASASKRPSLRIGHG